MSTHLLLVLDLEHRLAFDRERVLKCITKLPGTRGLDDSNPRQEFFCEFDFAGDSTIVHMLKDESHFISVEGIGIASLQVALEIQRAYGDRIYAFDDQCSFCVLLSEISSLDDFNNRIKCNCGSDMLELEFCKLRVDVVKTGIRRCVGVGFQVIRSRV